MLKIALRGMRQHPGRLIMSALAVVLGVSFVTASFVITDSLDAIFTSVVRSINADVDLAIRTEAGPQRSPVLESGLDAVKATPGVASADGFVGGFVQVITADGRAISPSAGAPLALSWSAEPTLTPLRATEGARPTGPREVAVDRRTADDWSIVVGDAVTVAAGAKAPQPFTVVAIAGFGSGNYPGGSSLFAFELDTLQELLGSQGAFDSILVDIEPNAPPSQVALLLRELPLGDRIEVATSAELIAEGRENIDDGLRFLRIGLYGFSLVSVLVAGFLIVNTFGVVVAQRTRELGLLAALGATPRQLFGSVIAEAILLGAGASLGGIAVGFAGATGLRALLGWFGFALPAGGLPLRPRTIGLALVVGVGAAVFAAAVPARRAATIPPMAAIRSGYASGGRLRAGRIAIGVVLVLVAYGIATIGLLGWTGNAPATVGIAGLVGFTAFVVLGPGLAALAAGTARSARSVSTRLAADGIRRQPVRTAATASALAVGVSLVTGVGVFASSATESLHHDLRAGLTADAVIEGDQFFELGGFVAERARNTEGAAVTAVIRRAQITTETTRETLAGVDPALLDAVLDVGLVRGDLGGLANDSGLALQLDAARAFGVDVGDDLIVGLPLLGRRAVPVVAVYRNASVMGSIFMSDRLFTAAAGQGASNLVLVKAADGTSPSQLRANLAEALIDAPFVAVRDPAGYEAARAEQVDRLLALTAMLLGAAIAVAVLGVANTLALSVLERRRELGLLRAVGMTTGQAESLVTWEAVVVGVLGVAGGITLGTAVGAAFAFSLSGAGITRVAVPVTRLVAFALLAGVSAVTAAVVPARRAGRADVLAAIAAD
ncbi:MAG: FtsX-like permease family protein [Acidimicrobiales bacterium]